MEKTMTLNLRVNPMVKQEAENRKGIRQIVSGHYSAFYIVRGDEVTVLRVLYSAADISAKLQEHPGTLEK